MTLRVPTFKDITAWVRSRFGVKAHHESGKRFSRDRSDLGLWSGPRDSIYDDPPRDRLVALDKARYWERNSDIVQILADKFEQYTVGAGGMPIIPNSSDEKWNDRRLETWNLFCRYPDLVSRQDFGTFQGLVARRWFIDGEVFLFKTRSDEAPFRPRCQLIESHRVRTPERLYGQEGKTMFDGVETDAKGRPVAYHVAENGTFRRISADKIIHVFEPSRANQYRAFTFLDSVLDKIHDLSDLDRAEMLAAKDASEKANVVKNAAGEETDEDVLREAHEVDTQNATGTDTTENRVRHYSERLGGRTLFLKEGEELEQFRSNRPTVAQQWYWDYLISRICGGVGISKMLVFPWSIQGTIARGIYDEQDTFFRSRSAVLQCAFTEVYIYVTEDEIKTNVRLSDPPFDWREVIVVPPRSVSVDAGYDTESILKLVESGLCTFAEAWGRFGKYWKPQVRQKAIEAAYIKKLAKEYDLEVSEISTLQQDRENIADTFGGKNGKPQKGQKTPTEKRKEEDEEPVTP